MKIFKITTTYSTNIHIVAESYAEVERIFNAKYWPTNIKEIELISNNVLIQKHDEQPQDTNNE